jgi:hypothetical protein
MHVATMALVACLAFAVAPWLGIVASLCTVLVAIASVSLGWHYALDGYVGALLAIVVWSIAGWMERMIADRLLARATDLRPAWSPLGGGLATANVQQGAVAESSANRARVSARGFFDRRIPEKSHREQRPG